MEAWGIIMTVFTLFGMLALVVADLGGPAGEGGEVCFTSAALTDEPTAQPVDEKKAA